MTRKKNVPHTQWQSLGNYMNTRENIHKPKEKKIHSPTHRWDLKKNYTNSNTHGDCFNASHEHSSVQKTVQKKAKKK